MREKTSRADGSAAASICICRSLLEAALPWEEHMALGFAAVKGTVMGPVYSLRRARSLVVEPIESAVNTT